MERLKRTGPRVREQLQASIGATCAALIFVSFFLRAAHGQSTNGPTGKPPEFEVASVRLMVDRDKLPMEQQMSYLSPSGSAEFIARNLTLTNLIGFTYGVDDATQIVGRPDWMDSTFYEIAAKPEGDAELTYDQLKPFVAQLLKERFHLKFHRETKNVKGYALIVAKGGPKLTATKGGSAHAYLMTGRFDAVNAHVSELAVMLTHSLRETVVDKTGLKGNFDFKLNYAPMDATDSTQPSIFTALDEQLGLRLEKQVVPVEMFVIDHVDKVPTEN
jgi:uncharacterized protein (TIGR03435 family)